MPRSGRVATMPAQRQNVSDREALLSCMEQGSLVVCNRTSVVNLVEKDCREDTGVIGTSKSQT